VELVLLVRVVLSLLKAEKVPDLTVDLSQSTAARHHLRQATVAAFPSLLALV
jgi:hypothetical protein